MSGFHPVRLRQRATAARWILAILFTVLGLAFFRTQIVQHERYRLRAEGNRLRPVPLTPPRGAILDRHGNIIAENVPGYSVKLLASSEDSLRAVLARMQAYVPLDSSAIEDVVGRFQASRYQPAVVLGDADFATVARLEEHRIRLPGLVIQAEPKRLYPAGKAVAHLVGYVGEVTESDLQSGRYPGARLGTLVGKAGLELEYDSVLRGTPGVRYVEVDVRGRMVREHGAAPTLLPVAGSPIKTTVDLPLQEYIDSIWPRGVRGAAVAMTPDGQILAMYSAPSYDPNEFIGGISSTLWHRLNSDSANPLLNRAIQARYAPASPFKLAMAIMGMERGIVNIHSRMDIPCRGGLQFGNRYFRCWKPEGHGSLDLLGAIAQSCDVYFYQLGLKLGLNAILEEGVRLGFRERTGVDLQYEQTPIFPASRAYYDRRYGPRGWVEGSTTMNLAIGQGENDQTPIAMTAFYEGLANGGIEHVPYLVRPTTTQVRDFHLSPKEAEDLRRALATVVTQGTAAASQTARFTFAGKTGTAQNPFGKDHGWFIGFAPAENPKIVIGMVMEFAEHGSNVAPYVAHIAGRYLLGPEEPAMTQLRVAAPEDTAPRSLEVQHRPVASPKGDSVTVRRPGPVMP